MSRGRLSGKVDPLVVLDVFDERLGVAYPVEVRFRSVSFAGEYHDDPGVRWHPDGSGDPPSFDCEVEYEGVMGWLWFSAQHLCHMEVGCSTVLETDASLLMAVEDGIDDAINGRWRSFVDGVMDA